jgi:hypothetical protein
LFLLRQRIDKEGHLEKIVVVKYNGMEMKRYKTKTEKRKKKISLFACYKIMWGHINKCPCPNLLLYIYATQKNKYMCTCMFLGRIIQRHKVCASNMEHILENDLDLSNFYVEKNGCSNW